MANSKLKSYYTEERIAELVKFANEYARVAKTGYTIIGVDVDETICHHPFVSFIQDNGERILTEMF